MQSRTFCFNKTIFRKNITYFWPIWTAYTLILTFMLPIGLFVSTQNPEKAAAGMTKEAVQRNFETYIHFLDVSMTPSFVFAAAAVCAVAVFFYLYQTRSVNMIHAMPVSRKELYITNFVSGYLFLAVPQCLTFLLTSFVCLARDISSLEYLLYWFLMMLGMGFFAYAGVVCAGMFTGQFIMAPVFFVIANFLYIGIKFIVGAMQLTMLYGIRDLYGWKRGGMFFSPLYYLERCAGIHMTAERSGDYLVQVTGGRETAVYAAIAVVLVLFGYAAYRRKKLETVGDFITVEWLKPVFRWGTTICLSALAAAVISGVFKETFLIHSRVPVILGTVVSGGIIFFLSQMIVEKQFRVFERKRFLECAGVLAVTLILVTGISMDITGMEKRVPDAEELKSVCMRMGLTILEEDEKEIERILAMHKKIIESKDEFLGARYAAGDEEYSLVELRYDYKNGDTLYRCYEIPSRREDIADEHSMINTVLREENRYENYMKGMFGKNYRTSEPVSISLDVPNKKTGYMKTFYLPSELNEELFAAVKKDVREGNLKERPYEVMEEKNYYSSLCIEYYNPKGTGEMDAYFYRDTAAGEPYMDVAVSETEEKNGTAYIGFSKECEHILSVLRKAEIFNEEYGLMTISEYEKLENKE